jgi:hypothetical protein
MKTIEFAGAPDSGKTTAVASIERLARENGYYVRHFHGGGRYVPLQVKSTPRFNLAVASRNVYEALTAVSTTGPSVRLLDRGPIDSLLFSRALAACGRLPAEELSVVEQLITSPQVLAQLDLVVLLSADPAVLSGRERALTGRVGPGATNNQPMLEALTKETRRMFADVKALGLDVMLLDNTNMSITETRRALIERVEPLLVTSVSSVPIGDGEP